MPVKIIVHTPIDQPLAEWHDAMERWDYFDVKMEDKQVRSITELDVSPTESGCEVYRLVWLTPEDGYWANQAEEGKAARTYFFCDPKLEIPNGAEPLINDFKGDDGKLNEEHLKNFIDRKILKSDVETLHLKGLKERFTDRWKKVAELSDEPDHPLRPPEETPLTGGERLALQRKFQDLNDGFDALIDRDRAAREKDPADYRTRFRLSELLDTTKYLTLWKQRLENAPDPPLAPHYFRVPDLPGKQAHLVVEGNGALLDFAFLRIFAALYSEIGKNELEKNVAGEWEDVADGEGEACFKFDSAIDCYKKMGEQPDPWEHLDMNHADINTNFRCIAKRMSHEIAGFSLRYGKKAGATFSIAEAPDVGLQP